MHGKGIRISGRVTGLVVLNLFGTIVGLLVNEVVLTEAVLLS